MTPGRAVSGPSRPPRLGPSPPRRLALTEDAGGGQHGGIAGPATVASWGSTCRSALWVALASLATVAPHRGMRRRPAPRHCGCGHHGDPAARGHRLPPAGTGCDASSAAASSSSPRLAAALTPASSTGNAGVRQSRQDARGPVPASRASRLHGARIWSVAHHLAGSSRASLAWSAGCGLGDLVCHVHDAVDVPGQPDCHRDQVTLVGGLGLPSEGHDDPRSVPLPSRAHGPHQPGSPCPAKTRSTRRQDDEACHRDVHPAVSLPLLPTISRRA
jgi:hypothetical protein